MFNHHSVTLTYLNNCGFCHTCGGLLIHARMADRVPDPKGEEFCPNCKMFPDYASHSGRGGACPDYRMQAIQTRLRLAADPDTVKALKARLSLNQLQERIGSDEGY